MRQILAAKAVGVKNVNIITTSGAKLGRTLRAYAAEKEINLLHFRATYNIMIGKMYI